MCIAAFHKTYAKFREIATMKAIVKTGFGEKQLELQEVPMPLCGDNEVLIKVKAMGICNSDLRIFLGEQMTNVPIILGQEFSGEIVEIGYKTQKFKAGDRVTSRFSPHACNSCSNCLRRDYHLCLYKRSPGILSNGAFAEYVSLPEAILYIIPDNVSYESATLMEPAATVAYGILERVKIDPEEVVVIIGPGVIGLLALQMARFSGAKKIVMIGQNQDKEKRLPLAIDLGADLAISSSDNDIRSSILSFSGGRGVDLLVDCVGSAEVVTLGIDLLRMYGRYCALGQLLSEDICIPWKKIITHNLSLEFVDSATPLSSSIIYSLFERGVINTDKLITEICNLEEYESLFLKMAKGEIIKAVMTNND